MAKTFHELCSDAKDNVTECSIGEVRKMFENKEDFMLVDVREDNEFKEGRIKGAVHIGKGIIERDIHLHTPDHDKKIVLYCGGGFRSVLAAESLMKLGYNNVISMAGGWKGWKDEGGEVE
ncbi:MAG: rhodanese-like domain-containing protein [Ignavibacteria bacterium]